MSTKICTSIEQSKKLLNLGLDPSTADMYWYKFDKNKDTEWTAAVQYEDLCDGEISCWSLTALLELIPQDNNLEHYWEGWYITYELYEGHFTEDHDNPLDAAFEMVCWLIEQGHIKVNK